MIAPLSFENFNPPLWGEELSLSFTQSLRKQWEPSVQKREKKSIRFDSSFLYQYRYFIKNFSETVANKVVDTVYFNK